MFAQFTALLVATASLVSGAAIAPRGAGSAWMTPHAQYGSSIGVPGCKINTNRVAYWPGSVDCDNICLKVSNEGRHVYLLKIDQSQGAYDISYDAWNYLKCGKSATEQPEAGGPIAFNYEHVHASKCAHLMHAGKLPLEAVPSMNYLNSCLQQPNSWVAKNHKIFNFWNAVCTLGADEECTYDPTVSNQPSCPSGFSVVTKQLSTCKVYNIDYMTGKKSQAV